MQPNTTLGVPGMLTGKYFDGSCSFGEYVSSCYGDESLLEIYRRMNVPMFALLGCFERFGYSNRLNDSGEDSGKANRGFAISRRLPGQQAWNLFEIVRFRLTPFILKGRMLAKTMANWDAFKDVNSEDVVYPILANGKVSDADELSFHFYHTRGCHVPYLTDRYGRKCETLQGYKGSYEKTYFALSELVKFFAKLKAKGVYDNSLIVVTADHGNYDAKRGSVGNVDLQKDSVLNRAFPCMAVKPEGAIGDLRFDDRPTSHTRLKPFLGAAANKVISMKEIGHELQCDGDRLFRVPLKEICDDWIFKPQGLIEHCQVRLKGDATRLEPIKIGKRYSLRNSNASVGTLPPVLFDGVDSSFVTAPILRGGRMGLKFKVPDLNSLYQVRFEVGVVAKENAEENDEPNTFSIDGGDSIQLQADGIVEVEAGSLHPDKDGVVTISAQLQGRRFDMLIYAITVKQVME